MSHNTRTETNMKFNVLIYSLNGKAGECPNNLN